MSFRTRLSIFFVVIVILPMLTVGLLVFRLIGQSQQGKTDARANGLATAAGSIYTREASTGRAEAEAIARAIALLNGQALRARVAQLRSRSRAARVTVAAAGHTILNLGNRDAIAPGVATVKSSTGGPTLTVTVSELTAADLVRDLAARDVGVVVRQGDRR